MAFTAHVRSRAVRDGHLGLDGCESVDEVRVVPLDAQLLGLGERAPPVAPYASTTCLPGLAGGFPRGLLMHGAHHILELSVDLHRGLKLDIHLAGHLPGSSAFKTDRRRYVSPRFAKNTGMSLRVTQGAENRKFSNPGKYHPDNTEPVVPIELTSNFTSREALASFEPSIPGVYVGQGFTLHKLAGESYGATSTYGSGSTFKEHVSGKVGQKAWVTSLGKTSLATGPGK